MNSRRNSIRLYTLMKLFIYTSSIKGVTSSNTSLPLPKDWDILCPYTDICHHKAAKTKQFPVTKIPCCYSCSCEEDCGLHRNCCQYSMDTYRIDEQYQTTCTSLTTYDIDTKAHLYETHMFKIIDKCPNSTSCYDFHVSELGSMYPVISNTTYVIFLNDMCALCHGVNSTLYWDIELNCELQQSEIIYSSDAFIKYLKMLTDSNMCDIRFLPPSNINLNFHRCSVKYTSVIDDCLFKKYTDVIDTETQQLCHSYNATYSYMRAKFANIHCYLCSSKVKVQHVCDAEDYIRLSIKPFSFLLTSKDISELESELTLVEPECIGRCKCKHNEAIEKQTGSCRRLRCPVAMLEIGGRCSYITDSMTAGPFLSYIKLKLEDGVNRSELMNVATRRKLFTNVLRAWTKDIYIPAYSPSVDYFIVRVMHPRKTLNMDAFVNEFRSTIDTPWYLNVKGKRYRMSAIIHKHSDYFKCYTADLMIYIPHYNELNCTELLKNEEEQLEIIQLEQLLFDGILFTKFYFCNHVDLRQAEYVMLGEKLFFKITNKTYEKIEYLSIFDKGKNKVSLCLSDFGDNFWLQLRSSKSFYFFRSIAYLLLFLLHFIQ